MPGSPPPNALTSDLAIKVEGVALRPNWMDDLVEVRISSAVSMASRCELRFADPVFEHADDTFFSVGREVKVEMSDFTGTLKPVFSGEITAIGLDQNQGHLSEYVIEVYDRAHRLGHASKLRTFVDMSYADMVTKIAQEAGLQANVSGSSVTSPVFKYMLQRSSDFAFLDMITQRTGTEWLVDDKKLILRKRPTGTEVALKYGDNMLRFTARYSATEHIKSVRTMGWDPTTKQPIVYTTAPSATRKPDGMSSVGILDDAQTMANSFGGLMITGANVVETSAEATQLADALAARQATSELVIRGDAFGNADIKPGVMVKLANVGTKLSGKYYVTEVEHRYNSRDGLITKFTAGGHEGRAVVDLLGSATDVGTWGRDGLLVGLVTNTNDPDKLGRVKVKFPSLGETIESSWARLVTIGAGNDRGWQIVPEVNDEVIVAFEQGDPRRPLVLGAVWNHNDRPPLPSDTVVKRNKTMSWVLKSRKKHQVLFADEEADDKTGIMLQTGDGKSKVLITQDKIQVLTQEKIIELSNTKGSIVIAANGDITLKGNNIKLESQANTSIKATGNVETKSTGTTKIESSTSLEVKASAAAKVEASGILELKGSMAKIN